MIRAAIRYLRHRQEVAEAKLNEPHELARLNAEHDHLVGELNAVLESDAPGAGGKRMAIEMQLSSIQEEKSEVLRTEKKIETRYLTELAEEFLIPLPDGDEYWEQYHVGAVRATNLSLKGIAALRQDIRRERNDRFISLQSRLALVLAIVSLIISLVKA